jgi:M6 family metalloprotease-like protein
MKTKTILIILLLLVEMTVGAIPAFHGVQSMKQSDGTTLLYYLVGDEHCHRFVTTDGYMIRPDVNANGTMRYVEVNADGEETMTSFIAHNAKDRSETEKTRLETIGKADFGKIYQQIISKQQKVSRLQGGEFPTIGNLRGVILLVNFKDKAMDPSHTCEMFHSEMNDPGYSENGATGSARDYFMDQSMGLFIPTFDVYGPITLKNNMQYYGQNDGNGNDINPGKMIAEACQIGHDSLGVDFSKYDFNNDGTVDFVYVIYAGYAESYGAPSYTIWPHASNLTSQGIDCSLDGKQLQRYACSSELKYTSGTQLEGIGTFCHEFSHVLGLPDMYDTYNSARTQLGAWDIMDQGNYNNESRTPPAYSAFERYSLNWLNFTDIDTPSDSMSLVELTKNNVAYRIRTANDNEYFTLENRQQVGWDAYQPGKGLMIVHVSYDPAAWNGNYVNAGSPPHYDLEEADGTQGYNQGTDLYPIPGNDMFTDYSTPNSLSWGDVPTEKGITRIKDINGIITFRFMKDRLRRPVLQDPQNISDNSFIANWNPVDEATAYRIKMQEVLPDSLNPIIDNEDFSGMTDGAYSKSGTTDISETLDGYMKRSGWSGSDLYSCGGYIRIGSYGKSGSLMSPDLDLSSCNGTFTIALDAISYPGKSVDYAVSYTDMTTGNIVKKVSLKAGNTKMYHRFVFTGGTKRGRISITTNKERLFLNDLVIIKGDKDSAAIKADGPKSWVIDSIAGTSYRVGDLISNRTYKYSVQALSKDELCSSLYSDIGNITTTVSLGIDETLHPVSSKIRTVRYYDLSGREIDCPQRGVVICRTIYDDGSLKTSKIVIK